MATIAELMVKIGGDIKDLESKMSQAQRSVSDTGKSVAAMGKQMSKVVTTSITGLAAGVLALQKRTADYASTLNDLSNTTGHSTDSLQELTWAFSQAGIGQDMTRRLIERNTQRLGRAADGNETFAAAYERLGVSIRNANGQMRSSEAVFDDVLEGLAGITNESERAAVAGTLLGTNAGRRLAGALNGGISSMNEARQAAHDMGIVMSEDAVQAANRFSNMMDALQQRIAAAGRNFAVDLMPAVMDFIPVIESALSRVSSLVRRFTEMDREGQKQIMMWMGIAAAIGP